MSKHPRGLSLWPLASADTAHFMCIALATRLLRLSLSVVCPAYPFPQEQWYFQPTSEGSAGWL